jgi:hypothetical protein
MRGLMESHSLVDPLPERFCLGEGRVPCRSDMRREILFLQEAGACFVYMYRKQALYTSIEGGKKGQTLPRETIARINSRYYRSRPFLALRR